MFLTNSWASSSIRPAVSTATKTFPSFLIVCRIVADRNKIKFYKTKPQFCILILLCSTEHTFMYWSFYFLLNNCSSLALRRDWTYVALKASVIIKEGLEIFSNTQPFKCLKQKQFSLEDNMYVKEDNSYSLTWMKHLFAWMLIFLDKLTFLFCDYNLQHTQFLLHRL